MKEYIISLTDLHFHSRHGVLAVERATGNDFIVDVEVVIPYDESILDDNLEATISYADIYAMVAEEMSQPRQLLETVAATLQRRICARWPQIKRGRITICKSTPPIAGITGSAKVSLIF